MPSRYCRESFPLSSPSVHFPPHNILFLIRHADLKIALHGSHGIFQNEKFHTRHGVPVARPFGRYVQRHELGVPALIVLPNTAPPGRWITRSTCVVEVLSLDAGRT